MLQTHSIKVMTKTYDSKANEEDIIQLRKQNKERMDAIFNNPNWRKDLGVKYFGEEEWFKIYHGERHPEFQEIKKESGYHQTRSNVSYVKKPLSQYDLEGNFIKSFKNVKEVLIEYNWEAKHQTHIMMACKGKAVTAYGYVWKFNESVENE